MEKNCATGKYILFYDDFRSGIKPGTTDSPYSFFTAPGLPMANDAAGGVTTQPQLLSINSTPFTYTNPTGLDHVKYLVYQEPYDAPSNGIELVYEGIISVSQTGLNNLPNDIKGGFQGVKGVTNVNADVRLTSAGLTTLDPETLLVFDFFLTNEDIYALYERLPNLRTEFGGPGPNYTGFTHVVPVGKRNIADPLNDFVKLAIAYNYRDNLVRWLINDIEVFRVNRLGLPIERKYRILEENVPGQIQAPSPLLRPKQLSLGFGTFSIMDAYNPQNPGQLDNSGLVDLSLNGSLPYADPVITKVNGTAAPVTFLADYNSLGTGTTGTNFGQGAILRIKYLTVYLLAPDLENRKFDNLRNCKQETILSRCTQNSIQGVNSHDDLFAPHCKGYIDYRDKCEIAPEFTCGEYIFPQTNSLL